MSSTPFGDFLRQKRVEAKKSLREIADHLGVSHVYLSQVERGKTTPLTEDKWEKLIEALPEITLEELQELSDQSRPVNLELASLSKERREVGLLLARKLEELPEHDLEEILKILLNN